ncbi:hypothetical protein MW290_28035 [Aquincola tertiaricarbonis]|uniref:Uncharacterized protein n=1 Tax=Aquincola tertiaricarbonis TaxID=391953 RepID=A0ABY4SBZ0_AQUTE|nr:hypothetical protein [Aquincola tertiaricarbonis]URI09417.1 hypothetical protein MW290_28035 [Aquincola tertiaricarbonis]
MQLARSSRGQAVAAFVCALLMGPAAQGATTATADSMHAAAEAARRDVDPSVNGALGDVPRVSSAGLLSDAATSARRDSDPSLNGRLVDSLPPQASVAGGSHLTGAWEAYERCHWQAAFGAFAAAADAGVPEAARMALAMVKHGSLLYRQVFVVSAAQRGSWQRLVQFASASPASASSARGVTQ